MEKHRWTEDEVATLVNLLRREGGITVAEAAEEMGLRPQQVSTKAAEARKRLAERGTDVPKFRRAAMDRSHQVEAFWSKVSEQVG